jgi:hypothetical protein
MAADTQNHSFPPAVAKAVVEVMQALGTLGKSMSARPGRNTNTPRSTTFILHVRGHCAEAGWHHPR